MAAPHYITLALSPAGKLQRLCDGSGCRVGRKIKAADRWTVTGFSLIIWRMCLVKGEKHTHTKKERGGRRSDGSKHFVLLLKLEYIFFLLTFFHWLPAPAHSELSGAAPYKGQRATRTRVFLRYLLLCWLASGREP